ncbi:hypothetical protein A2U01_0080233, partial [Trifolium medium]|nr:hypothetical protein [Trifolium medium]
MAVHRSLVEVDARRSMVEVDAGKINGSNGTKAGTRGNIVLHGI